MPRVKLYIAASLDGFIADRDGGVGWLDDIHPSEADGDFGYAEFYDSVGSLVMGRATYDQVLDFGAWPYPGKPSYVFTSHPPDGDHPNVEFISGDPRAFIKSLRAGSEQDIWLVGGGKLIASFREHGLIDEYIMTTIPVLLGDGIPLFPGNQTPGELRLVDVKRFDSGLAQLKYVTVQANTTLSERAY